MVNSRGYKKLIFMVIKDLIFDGVWFVEYVIGII